MMEVDTLEIMEEHIQLSWGLHVHQFTGSIWLVGAHTHTPFFPGYPTNVEKYFHPSKKTHPSPPLYGPKYVYRVQGGAP